MGGKGKSRRRRAANYLDSHDPGSLAPPPSVKDVGAIPSKVRRLMELKSKMLNSAGPSLSSAKSKLTGGSWNGGVRGTKEEPIKCAVHGNRGQKVSADSTEKDKHGNEVCGNADPSVQNEKPAQKRKRGEDMQTLMTKLNIAPAKRGIPERRKRYLQEKKNTKKKKQRVVEGQGLNPLFKHDNIKFGEVVDAPPKLSVPSKIAKQAEHQKQIFAVSQERIRMQAVEAYRQRRQWNRPGMKIPMLTADSKIDEV